MENSEQTTKIGRIDRNKHKKGSCGIWNRISPSASIHGWIPAAKRHMNMTGRRSACGKAPAHPKEENA